ncbi:unnamed protein product [Clonostachys rhizophaga]|uniref:Uncharacterized protein n=1 Tax=Clonostachys rhizophaga TaxID=160324 RepID=A0A9N9W1J1_9HYPO|nr:unnamed protein product [Clonostachys rhizophaga]
MLTLYNNSLGEFLLLRSQGPIWARCESFWRETMGSCKCHLCRQSGTSMCRTQVDYMLSLCWLLLFKMSAFSHSPKRTKILDSLENESRDLADIKPLKRAEALLKEYFGKSGWTELEDPLADAILAMS